MTINHLFSRISNNKNISYTRSIKILPKTFFTDCACPQGRMGRTMLKFMNLCHAPLTNWEHHATHGDIGIDDVAEDAHRRSSRYTSTAS